MTKSTTIPIFKTFLTLFFCALILTSSALASDSSQWLTDLDTALTESAKTKKPVLADFSGSDWCKWCVKLDEEVFSKSTFLTWAKDNVILCMIDFPKDKSKIAVNQQKLNKEAMNFYKEKGALRGFPTVLLLKEDRSVIFQTGYAPGGPEAYIKMLEKHLK